MKKGLGNLMRGIIKKQTYLECKVCGKVIVGTGGHQAEYLMKYHLLSLHPEKFNIDFKMYITERFIY